MCWKANRRYTDNLNKRLTLLTSAKVLGTIVSSSPHIMSASCWTCTKQNCLTNEWKETTLKGWQSLTYAPHLRKKAWYVSTNKNSYILSCLLFHILKKFLIITSKNYLLKNTLKEPVQTLTEDIQNGWTTNVNIYLSISLYINNLCS